MDFFLFYNKISSTLVDENRKEYLNTILWK